MIGQEKLLNKLNNYTIDTFPRSVILCGEKGSGKHTITNYIKDNIVKLPMMEITENISDEYLDAIYRNPNPYIYLIDINKLTEKEQNTILKFIEEPLANSFIIILVENRNSILNTVLNRCIIFELEQYTKEQLMTFLPENIDRELALTLLKTPGKIINTDLSTLVSIVEVTNKISTSLKVVNFSNLLTIVNKINFKDEYSKFDFDIFMDSLENSLYNQFLLSKDTNMLNLYLLVEKQRKVVLDTRVNREIFMYNLLTQMWKLSRGIK